MRFQQNTTFAISGVLTLDGALTNEIVLNSVDDTNQFNFDIDSDQSVSFVNVKNSNVDDAAFDTSNISATKSSDSGNREKI